MRRAAQQLMSELGLDINTDRSVDQLRVGQRQLVEIAKALNLNSQIIIMDEPTSALSDTEVEYLFQVIATCAGGSCHHLHLPPLEEVFAIADRITCSAMVKWWAVHPPATLLACS